MIENFKTSINWYIQDNNNNNYKIIKRKSRRTTETDY